MGCVTTRKWKLAKSWSVVRWESEVGAADRKREIAIWLVVVISVLK